MTEIPPQPTPRRLTRPTDDRMIAGVASGLGRHFDLDPLLFRVGFVVLALFGGSGLLLYLLLALLVPSEGQPREDGRGRTLLVVLAVIVACIAIPFALPAAFFLSPLIVLAAIGLLIWRAAGGDVDSRAVKASVIVLAIAAAVVLGLGAAAAVAFGAGTAMSVIVLASGVALVVAAFVGGGGARWLIAPALVLAIPVAIVAAADIDLKGGVGERDYRPATVADLRDEYRLGAGELTLDLRDVDFPSGRTTVRTHLGMGSLRVMLPEDACLDSDVHVGMGDVQVLGRSNGGIDVDASRREDAPGDAAIVRVEVDAGVADVHIHRGDRYISGTDDEGCDRA